MVTLQQIYICLTNFYLEMIQIQQKVDCCRPYSLSNPGNQWVSYIICKGNCLLKYALVVLLIYLEALERNLNPVNGFWIACNSNLISYAMMMFKTQRYVTTEYTQNVAIDFKWNETIFSKLFFYIVFSSK